MPYAPGTGTPAKENKAKPTLANIISFSGTIYDTAKENKIYAKRIYELLHGPNEDESGDIGLATVPKGLIDNLDRQLTDIKGQVSSTAYYLQQIEGLLDEYSGTQIKASHS